MNSARHWYVSGFSRGRAYVHYMNDEQANQSQPEKPNAAQPANTTTTVDPAPASSPPLNEFGEELYFWVQVQIASGVPPARMKKMLDDIEAGRAPQLEDAARNLVKVTRETLLMQVQLLTKVVQPFIAAIDRQDLTLPEFLFAKSQVEKYHETIEKLSPSIKNVTPILHPKGGR